MNTDHNAIAASLDAAQVADLAQLNDEAFWDYARHLAGVVPIALFSSFPASYSSDLSTSEQEHSAPAVNVMAATELLSSAYLECIVGEHRCLLPLSALAEIVPAPQHLTFLPTMPFWMLGLTAWRGEPVAVIDLQSYLTDSRTDTHADDADSATRGGMLLMLHHTTATFGLFVSGTGAVATIPAEQLAPKKSAHEAIVWLAPSRVDLLAGISESRVALDVSQLLDALTRQIGAVTAHG